MFTDKVLVKVRAGNGGNGCISFRQEKFVDKGGPDGGDGGKGGDVIAIAAHNVDTLAEFRYQKKLSAEEGAPGFKQRKHGKNGADLEIKLPIGTVISDADGRMLADMTEDGQQVVIAKGGKGGFGNAHFVSSVRQAPKFAEKGEKGEDKELIFEIKSIADVGLVGLPNAGKSTFLSVTSNARPEIANYPFTTLRPHLGVSDIDGYSLLIADIPGLIEGASEGKGLGDEFLRHVERTNVLLHLIDIYNDDVVGAYRTIMEELKAYSPALVERPMVIALTKIDGLDEEIIQMQKDALKAAAGKDIYAISASSKKGIQELLYKLKDVVRAEKIRQAEQAAKQEAEVPVMTIETVPDDSWEVVKKSRYYLVTGKQIEKFAERTEFTNWQGVQRLRDIMRKKGIMQELERLGIEVDDRIVIGKPKAGEFTY